jgi:4-alpha-glucanotransferase
MKDAVIHDLAGRAGIAVEWTDHANKQRRVPIETLRAILTALGCPCGTSDDIAHSRQSLETGTNPPLITATSGQPVSLPFSGKLIAGRALLREEHGTRHDVNVDVSKTGWQLAAIQTPGYHSLELNDITIDIAVAPPRCPSVADITGARRAYGLAAQVYGLRRSGDCGIGDAGGVIALARQGAALGADILALSPVHALFGAKPKHFSPYSPSSRLFYNPLHADPQIVFGQDRVARALICSGAEKTATHMETQALVDWPQSTQVKMELFRHLFEDFVTHDLARGGGLAADFRGFRSARGRLLEDHAIFEVLHAHELRANPAAWNWTGWPEPFRDPAGHEVREFAMANEKDVTFQCFLQWLADRSFAAAEREAKRAGMRVGLVADLAVGMNSAGSHAWTSQGDILMDLEIGAPPDLYNAKGQNWGLTTFSPRALATNGFAPFIATLRASLRHAGGLRIDHAMGLMRLWVVPRGADPTAGAYLSYPLSDLWRLTALEAHRHGAIVIGEDLGTIPAGFRDRMAKAGMYGMRVLAFERVRGRFKPPQKWDVAVAAMTSTHDLPSVAGWWRGIDIESRARAGLVNNVESERQARAQERQLLWQAFRQARVADAKQPDSAEAPRVVDAAIKFIAQTESDILLLPLEDALALEEQPNVPGTIDECPNWRRRYPGQAADLLDPPRVKERVGWLAR